MGTISKPNTFSANTTISSSQVNSNFDTIYNDYNGNISANNLASNAITTVKITDGAVTTAKLAANAVTPAKLDSNFINGWITAAGSISAVVYNGNRSYSLTTSSDNTSTISPGMRLMTTRSLGAPTQSTSLNGTTQFYSKTSPAGMTFTNNFVVSAWVKLTSYAVCSIASRYNGTSGWDLTTQASGQIFLSGYNAGSGNTTNVSSYQSIPLNKWVHIAAQLDMTSTTVSPTVNYIMVDGVDVAAVVTRAGTNPTALVQAGNLEVGSRNGGLQPFPGKIAQVAIYNAKVTEANIRATISQTLAGTETSLISAYSFNNSIVDLNASNANNLTANASAVATNADSPFGGQAGGAISSTLDYAIIQTVSASTLVVQVAEGCTIPTTGGVSSASYGTKTPYGFPGQAEKWRINIPYASAISTTSNATFGSFNAGGTVITIPIGEWTAGWRSNYIYTNITSDTAFNLSPTSLTGKTVVQGQAASSMQAVIFSPSAAAIVTNVEVRRPQSLSAATLYIMYTFGATTGAGVDGSKGQFEMYAENAYL